MLSLTVALTLGLELDLPDGTIWTLPPLAVAVKLPFPTVLSDEASADAMVDAVLPFPHFTVAVTLSTVVLREPASYSVVVVAGAPPVSEPVPGEAVKSDVPTTLKAMLPALPVTLLVSFTRSPLTVAVTGDPDWFATDSSVVATLALVEVDV